MAASLEITRPPNRISQWPLTPALPNLCRRPPDGIQVSAWICEDATPAIRLEERVPVGSLGCGVVTQITRVGVASADHLSNQAAEQIGRYLRGPVRHPSRKAASQEFLLRAPAGFREAPAWRPCRAYGEWHDFPDPGRFPAVSCSSPSDTLKPHNRPFPGTPNHHPGLAFGRDGCCI